MKMENGQWKMEDVVMMRWRVRMLKSSKRQVGMITE